MVRHAVALAFAAVGLAAVADPSLAVLMNWNKPAGGNAGAAAN